MLRRLTYFGIQLATLPNEQALSAEHLQDLIVSKLRERNPTNISAGTPAGHTEAAQDLADHWSFAAKITGLHGLPAASRSAATQMSLLLRKPARNTHPIRILSTIEWLWSGWSAFLDDCKNSSAICEEQCETAPIENSESARQTTAVELIRLMTKGQSLTMAARRVGISVSAAQSIAASSGLRIHRRPKKLTLDIQNDLVAAAREGYSKHELAECSGLDPQTVMRFLKVEKGLFEEWRSALRAKSVSKNRGTWTEALDSDPEGGIKGARKRFKSTYAWLYRNDRSWLIQHNKDHANSRRGNNSSVDWRQRDLALSLEVSSALREYFSNKPASELTIGRLCEAVPRLRSKIRKLDCLPRTAEILRDYVALK